MNDEATISTLEAAERLSLDPVDVYKMIDAGQLSAAWVDGRLVVPVSEIDLLAKSAH